MATEEQLKAALIKADQAGDTQAAELFASKIKELRSQSQPMPSVKQSQQSAMQLDPVEGAAEGKEFSVLDNAIGALENLRAMSFGAVAEPIAGLSGLVAGAVPGGKTGAEMVEDIQQSVAEFAAPKTEAGIAQAQSLGDILAPVAETLENVRSGIGDYVFEKTDSPLLASIATAAPDAALSLVGSAPVATTARNVNTATKGAIRDLLKNAPQSKQAGKYIIDGAGRVKNSKAFKNTISQGFDEATMASVKGASQADKAKMNKMLSILEGGLKDARTAVVNRPSDVVGQSAVERIKFLKNTNKKAGREVDQAAKNLKGLDVDYTPAVDDFVAQLDEIGVKLDENQKPVFYGSDIEGATAAENFISKVVQRMRNTRDPDAYDAHRLKRFIDEQVTYGKVGEGLSGRAETIVKNLRRNLDAALDGAFPDYDAANTKYADTISALDSLQSGVGRVDLAGANADKALGTVMRRVMSNTQSRANLISSLDEIDSVAKKYGASFEDDIITQALFADELDSMFNLQNRTTFKGQAARGMKQASQGKQGLYEAAIDKAGEAVDKARGINDQSRIKSLRELIKERNIQ